MPEIGNLYGNNIAGEERRGSTSFYNPMHAAAMKENASLKAELRAREEELQAKDRELEEQRRENEQLRLQQLSVDASGIMLTRPDNYLPPVDIIKDHDATYRVYMDIPGMTREQVKLSRQNVVTIVKGSREPEFTQREMATSVARQERKHGDFTMTFRIPEEFQRKWDTCTVDNGVLCIT